MPPEVRRRCRVLLLSAIYWEIFAIYNPSKIACDMYEVLIESDLTIFVCPCGSQFTEEVNLYHHVRCVHKDFVFRPLQGMLSIDIKLLKSKCLSDFGDVHTEYNDGEIFDRLCKLFKFKQKIPRVPPYSLSENNDASKRLPKW